MRNNHLRIPIAIGMFLGASLAVGAALLLGSYYYLAPGLPNAEQLRDVRIETPLDVYTRDGRLMAQFGEVMRTPVAYRNVPPILIDAFLAAEDEHFFEHPGIDYRGVTRAAVHLLRTFGDRRVGGSTITQQVARMHFLSRERSFSRKLKEWILALRIEREFTKEEILELYLNTYFFGHRSYGVVTAARTYFGKELRELTVAEAALIAGIAQGPSIFNPLSSPQRASVRRAYVLRRMRELDMITEAQHAAGLAEPIESRRHGRQAELDAPYVAEMVRQEMVRRYGPDAVSAGFVVRTTIDSRLQRAANEAIREGLIAYDERHGYRGPVARVELPGGAEHDLALLRETAPQVLADFRDLARSTAALVLAVDDERALVYVRGRGEQRIGLEAVAWAARYVSDDHTGLRPRTVADVLQAGDVVRFWTTEEGKLRLAQVPEVQGALVALDPLDGAVVALTGGFDFALSNYNRSVQSARQPGSAFKPFIYSAALEHGFTPATIVNDAPLTMGSAELGTLWRPTNDSGLFYGDTRLREALVRSQNVASVRVVRDVGLDDTIRHLRGFGFGDVALPRNLTVSLGAGGVSPLDLAQGYAVFANGGSSVEPYFIERIEDARGNVLYAASPPLACASCAEEEGAARARGRRAAQGPRMPEAEAGGLSVPSGDAPRAPHVISPQNAYLMTDMMQDAIRRGTGQRALVLGRDDLAGKTGTSNTYIDAWFAGYNADLVATAWVGFDLQPRSLGRSAMGQESGSRTALPMWVSFMAAALAGSPERPLEQPPGIVELRINPMSGRVAGDRSTGTMFEKFYIDRVPQREYEAVFPGSTHTSRPGEAPQRAPSSIF